MTRAASGRGDEARALHRRLIGVYFKAAAIALFGGAALYGAGLDLTMRQFVLIVTVIAPAAFVPMVALDILSIGRTFRPLARYLRSDEPDESTTRDAFVRALNFPVLSALRVLLVHVPAVMVSATLLMMVLNRYTSLDLPFPQIAVMWLLTLFVGSGHALIEYFLVADVVRPLCLEIGRRVGTLSPEYSRKVVTIGTRRTLVLVSIFLVLTPMTLFGYTLLVKFGNVLSAAGVPDISARLLPIVAWIVLLIVVCITAGVFTSWRAGREVLRSTDEMSEAMRRVERNVFDQPLILSNAGEFRPLYDGFNAMTERLRVYVVNLREASRLKSEFINIASHELRTPVSVIKGYMELLGAGSLGPVTAAQQEAVTAIQRSLKVLLTVADDATQMAEVERDGVELSVELHEVRALLEQAMAAAFADAPRRSLVRRLDITPDVGMIEADGARLVRSVANLVRNAIRFTADGGSVQVAARRDATGVVIEVSDTGVGLSEENRAALFELEFEHRESLHHHSSSSLEFNSAGLGMGLRIARGIVEAHGGSITCESRLGRGSTFRLHLPAGLTVGYAASRVA